MGQLAVYENESYLEGVGELNEAPSALSEMELNFLNQLVDGRTTSEIAHHSGYSEPFIAIVLDKARERIGSKSLIHAIVMLLKSGVLKL